MMVAGHFSALSQHRWDGAIPRPVLRIQMIIWQKKKINKNAPLISSVPLKKKKKKRRGKCQLCPPSRAHQHATFTFMLNMKSCKQLHNTDAEQWWPANVSSSRIKAGCPSEPADPTIFMIPHSPNEP